MQRTDRAGFLLWNHAPRRDHVGHPEGSAEVYGDRACRRVLCHRDTSNSTHEKWERCPSRTTVPIRQSYPSARWFLDLHPPLPPTVRTLPIGVVRVPGVAQQRHRYIPMPRAPKAVLSARNAIIGYRRWGHPLWIGLVPRILGDAVLVRVEITWKTLIEDAFSVAATNGMCDLFALLTTGFQHIRV